MKAGGYGAHSRPNRRRERKGNFNSNRGGKFVKQTKIKQTNRRYYRPLVGFRGRSSNEMEIDGIRSCVSTQACDNHQGRSAVKNIFFFRGIQLIMKPKGERSSI